MKITGYGLLVGWVLAIGGLTGCSTGALNRGGDDPSGLPRGGEPTVAQKHAASLDLKKVAASHRSLGPADLDADTVTPLTKIGDVEVSETAPFHAVIFQSGLEVDADGSPKAYHPKPEDSEGLDALANAGSPGRWWGIVTDSGDESGNPVIQKSDGPAPGFYVSSTSLVNQELGRTDPRRYVDASTIPFFVLPGGNYFGGRLGDIAAVVNFRNGKIAYAIAADTGPKNKLGEGSIALAKALGINPSARSGGTDSGIGFCMFPGSGTQRPQSLSKINAIGKELFGEFGGVPELKKHLGAE